MLIGVIGKPSAGKSTFFAAATMLEVEIHDRPFTTIQPNRGVGYVRVKDIGPEFGVQSQPRTGFIQGPYRFVPVELVDVAGLIPGAHMGKGLGNQFMNDLIQADVLLHIVDMSGSTDEEGNPTTDHDPEKDIQWLEKEITMWLLGIIRRNEKKIERMVRMGKSASEIAQELLSVLGGHDWSIVEERFPDPLAWGEEFAQFLRERTKPILVVANKMDMPGAEENYQRLKDKYLMVPASAQAELILKKAARAGFVEYIPGESEFRVLKPLSASQQRALDKIEELLQKYGGTGVQQSLENAVFDLLGYKAVFPAGSKLKDKHGRVLPDCFLMPPGSTLFDFARRIHEDLARGLLYGIDARTKKKLAKDYVLKHRDAVEIVSTMAKHG